ncbi:MAG: HD domain-containing protein [Clostridia bacterium]|nr:HD domain-containing protein [Clostridia bacterium]
MKTGHFMEVALNEKSPKWLNCKRREHEIYKRDGDIRSEFTRDYNRILHCTAYRRLKHKTQVFFAARNDHICTRIEHVNHVASVSYSIAQHLGLNTELTVAISTGHDLGHAPFGHAGEEKIEKIIKKELGEGFWHERNSLRIVDKLETLPDPGGFERNLNLTYGVRDGIISHCGEVDENYLYPRDDFIKLEEIIERNQYNPYTWEGCVVKIADKIAYLGRDLEDALALKILSEGHIRKLQRMVKEFTGESLAEVNNTVLIHKFIVDLCNNSSPENGIRFSESYLNFIKALKDFSKKNIYGHPRLAIYKNYAELIIYSIFKTLKDLYKGESTLEEIEKYVDSYPLLLRTFKDWIYKYYSPTKTFSRPEKYKNEELYSFESKESYIQSIIDFISGMTDGYAIRIFNELTTF